MKKYYDASLTAIAPRCLTCLKPTMLVFAYYYGHKVVQSIHCHGEQHVVWETNTALYIRMQDGMPACADYPTELFPPRTPRDMLRYAHAKMIAMQSVGNDCTKRCRANSKRNPPKFHHHGSNKESI